MDREPAETRVDAACRGLLADPRLPALLVVAIAAATVALSVLNLGYDTWYALVWGRDLLEGRAPDYDALLSPTPHPLLTLLATPVALLPQAAAPVVMSAGIAASWIALCAAVWLLVARLFGPWMGALAGVLLATREPFLSLAVRGFVDIPFLALVIGAAAVEAGRRRAGLAVLALLAAAGLLRPEAWALSGLYVLWLWGGLTGAGRARAVAVAAIAPLGWAGFDLVTAGDALHSLTGTQENVAELGRATGLDDVPWRFFRLLGFLSAEPGIIGALAAAPLLWLLRSRTALLAVLFGAGLLVFAAYGTAGLPLISRYLTVPAIVLLCCCAAGLGAWRYLEGRERRLWRAAAIVGAVALLATVPVAAARIDRLTGDLRVRADIQDDLVDLARSGPTRAVLRRCPRVYLPNHRPVPILAWWLERPPSDFASAAAERPGDGAFIEPATAKVSEAFILDPRDPQPLEGEVPADFRRLAANDSWVLHARGC